MFEKIYLNLLSKEFLTIQRDILTNMLYFIYTIIHYVPLISVC